MGASEAVARLAQVYRLNTTELARGELHTALDVRVEEAVSRHVLSGKLASTHY